MNTNKTIPLIATLLLAFTMLGYAEVLIVSWNIHRSALVPCCPPGEEYSRDPYTGKRVENDCLKQCQGSRPGYRPGELSEQHSQIFESKGDAEKFKLGCSTATCTDWAVKEATNDDILRAYHWYCNESNPGFWEVASQKNNLPLAYGYDEKEAIKFAMLFQRKNWDLWLSGDQYIVRPKVNGMVYIDDHGRLREGGMDGKIVAAIASGSNVVSVEKEALKVAQIQDVTGGSSSK